jgi:hypothetical protein
MRPANPTLPPDELAAMLIENTSAANENRALHPALGTVTAAENTVPVSAGSVPDTSDGSHGMFTQVTTPTVTDSDGYSLDPLSENNIKKNLLTRHYHGVYFPYSGGTAQVSGTPALGKQSPPAVALLHFPHDQQQSVVALHRLSPLRREKRNEHRWLGPHTADIYAAAIGARRVAPI